MKGVPLRVVVTGPESTGKSTLAQRLAAEFGAPPAVPEYLRAFVDARLPVAPGSAPVEPEHSEVIARHQIAAEDAAAIEAEARGSSLVVCDTDPLSTLVYHEHYFGERPAWLAALVRARRYALSLLLDVDVPWVGDGQRDQPAARGLLFERFRGELRRCGRPFEEIAGDWDHRFEKARRAVARLLAAGA